MNIPCHVVEDLLPLYHDQVCSLESRALVEEHLTDCERCKHLLAELEGESAPASSIDDAAPLKSIRDQWTKSKKRSFLKGTLIALALCAVLLGGYLGLTQWRCIPVSADLLEVSEVSRLADGRIIYHLRVKDDRNLHFIKFTIREDGAYYITPMRAVIEGKRSMESGLFNDYFMVDVAEVNAYQQDHGDGITVTSCYIGPQQDGILLWQDGMELPQADAALEEMAK
jgi:hypothetical protein